MFASVTPFLYYYVHLLIINLLVLIKHKHTMDRRAKRLERLQRKAAAKSTANPASASSEAGNTALSTTSDEKFAKLLSQKEDVLLNLVAEINKIYTDNLGRPAPFVSFVICGMQSSGKSTIMER